jgi:cytochrome c
MKQIPTRILLLSLGILIAASPARAGDPEKGRQVFVKCERCHSLDPSGPQEDGPHLHNIFGRKAGSVESYTGYSEAMKASGVVWTEETLDLYIAKPKAFMEGTNMRFRSMRKEQDRQDLIAFLRENTQ